MNATTPCSEVLYQRLRREASPSSVRDSLPVLFFGDLFVARVATVGLNPSWQEYLHPDKRELAGPFRRFETLRSLGVPSRVSLTQEQCDKAITTMRGYFSPGKPVYRWFRPLDRVLRAMGFSYTERQVAHLDLVQEATDPVWANLEKQRWHEWQMLRGADLPFLQWQIEHFPLGILLCDGRTTYNTVIDMFDAHVIDSQKIARITWYVATAQIGSRLTFVVGWNIPLARPTGLGIKGEETLGRLLLERIGVSPS